ncbi:MAG: caspase family protein, partial [Pseudomonadota bacterium]
IWRRSNLGTTDLRYFIGAPGQPGQLAKWLADKGEDAELIVYFAGHGSREQNANGKTLPYLMGVDSRPESLQQTGFPLNTLVSELQAVQSRHLKKGRVMLVLESCFSGLAGDGSELVVGRSAPAWGKPQTASKLVKNANKRFIMMAAAQENQYAVWDKQWKRSVFTDALVSGLYGEADSERFNGDGNGRVTLGELKTFVKRRVERRLRATGIQDAQVPDYVGGSDDLALVKTDEMDGVFADQVERSHSERIEADVVLASRDMEGIESYLSNCLYCFNKTKLRAVVREEKRSASLCAIEERWLENVSGRTAVARLEAYLKTAKCKRLRPVAIEQIAVMKRKQRLADLRKRREDAKNAKLARAARLKAERELKAEEARLIAEERAAEKRLKAAEREAARLAKKKKRIAALTVPPTTDTPALDADEVGDETTETAVLDDESVTASDVGNDDAAIDDPKLMARRLQKELKRVGCLYGRVDGIWGRGSTAAFTRFAKRSNADVVGDIPSEAAIEAVEAVSTRVCPARKAKPKTWAKRKATPSTKKRSKRRSKNKVVYEVIEEKPKRRTKKRTRTKTTTYKAPKKKTYRAPKKRYTAPKKTYSGGSSSPTISRQCQRYGNFC